MNLENPMVIDSLWKDKEKEPKIKRGWNWLYDDSDSIYHCKKCAGEFFWRELTVGGLCEGCEYELE